MNSCENDQRRRGRPREVPQDAVRVSVRFSPTDYDRLDRLARVEGRSIPALVRQAISALTNSTPS